MGILSNFNCNFVAILRGAVPAEKWFDPRTLGTARSIPRRNADMSRKGIRSSATILVVQFGRAFVLLECIASVNDNQLTRDVGGGFGS